MLGEKLSEERTSPETDGLVLALLGGVVWGVLAVVVVTVTLPAPQASCSTSCKLKLPSLVVFVSLRVRISISALCSMTLMKLPIASSQQNSPRVTRRAMTRTAVFWLFMLTECSGVARSDDWPLKLRSWHYSWHRVNMSERESRVYLPHSTWTTWMVDPRCYHSSNSAVASHHDVITCLAIL